MLYCHCCCFNEDNVALHVISYMCLCIWGSKIAVDVQVLVPAELENGHGRPMGHFMASG